MALKVKWSKYADQSFDRILDYLKDEWGENVTRAFVRRTYEFLDVLAEFPEIGSLENSESKFGDSFLSNKLRSFYIRKNDYIILFY